MFQEVSVFLFEKRSAEKLHKPKRKETVTEILRASVRQLERFRHPKILQVNIRIQFCSPLCTRVNCSRSKLLQCLAEGNIAPLCFLLSILIQQQKSIAIWHHVQSLNLLCYIGFWSVVYPELSEINYHFVRIWFFLLSMYHFMSPWIVFSAIDFIQFYYFYSFQFSIRGLNNGTLYFH